MCYANLKTLGNAFRPPHRRHIDIGARGSASKWRSKETYVRFEIQRTEKQISCIMQVRDRCLGHDLWPDHPPGASRSPQPLRRKHLQVQHIWWSLISKGAGDNGKIQFAFYDRFIFFRFELKFYLVLVRKCIHIECSNWLKRELLYRLFDPLV